MIIIEGFTFFHYLSQILIFSFCFLFLCNFYKKLSGYRVTMGCCTSKESTTPKDGQELTIRQRDHQIEEQIKKDRQKMSNEVKLLLLGKHIATHFCLYQN